jgi:hypothetical protein
VAKFVLAYTGGGMAETEEAQQEAMAAWGAWFGSLGEAVVDSGAPFGGSEALGSDGSSAPGGATGLTGYSIVAADDLDAAVGLARSCPIFAAGGAVDVYEAISMM